MRSLGSVFVRVVLAVVMVSLGWGCLPSAQPAMGYACPTPGSEVIYSVALQPPVSGAYAGNYAYGEPYAACDITVRATYVGRQSSYVILPPDSPPRQASGKPGPGYTDQNTLGWAPVNWGPDARHLDAGSDEVKWALDKLPQWEQTNDGRGVVVMLRGRTSRGRFTATSFEVLNLNSVPETVLKERVCISHLQIGESEVVAPGVTRKLSHSDPRCSAGPCVFQYDSRPDMTLQELESYAEAAGCQRSVFSAFCCPSE